MKLSNFGFGLCKVPTGHSFRCPKGQGGLRPELLFKVTVNTSGWEVTELG